MGIGIDVDKDGKEKTDKTRTASDGQLYMASHVRMRDDVSLYLKIDGWSEQDFNDALRPLAGEHRMAGINAIPPTIELPKAAKSPEGRYCVILLSPMVLPDRPKGADESDKLATNKPDGLPGKLVSACLGKPVVIGGWNSTAKQPGPIPLRNCIPAGSIWFMEDGEGEYPSAIGQATEWGFGQVLIGKW